MADQNTGAPAPEPIVEPAAPTPAPEPVATPAPVAEPLPEGARDRTRDQFQKLIDSNRRLQERNVQLEAAQRQPAQVPGKIDPRDFVEVDPVSGEKYINDAKLRERLSESNQQVEQLKQQIEGIAKSSQQQEVERQERETYHAHPELNPKAKDFDPKFNQYVRSILTDSFYNSDEYGGRPFSFKEAADYVRTQMPKPKAAADVAAQAASTAAQDAKAQATAQPASQPRAQVQQDQSDDEILKNLQYRTRYLHDDEALAIRIINTDHVRKSEE